MRIILVSLTLLIVALAGVYGAGSSLPVEMTTIRGAQFRADVDLLWKIITDYENLPQWNSRIASVSPVPDPDDEESNLWHVVDVQDHYMILQVSNPRPGRLHRSEILETDLPFTSVWEFEIIPNDKGAFLKITDKTKIPNPFVRFVIYYIVGSDYGVDNFFNALAVHFVEDIEIQELAH